MPDISENIWRRIARGLALCTASCVSLALCACAPNTTDIEPRHQSSQVAAAVGENSDSQICRPDRALLIPAHAPDCAFGRSDLKTLDPDQWARLKTEYERKCYQNAERAVRERLRLLQAASRCEAAPARP
jgi:hypothetical protein